MRAHSFIWLILIFGPLWTFESCITKTIEGLTFKNERTSLEHVDLNQILRSIFKIYSLALENNSTVNHVNIIESTNGLICSEAGNLDRNYLLQLEWVDGRLLVFPNASSSALLLN